ncbi:DUF1488 domain-containing protein [Burkholderia sp. Nafp2/4-1b]|uniref:DUF1488 family protein n=1 Tax=Burkholderia sp. Nafp2/4-1b TaxID=2116686 RepID=UPI000EF967CE|nr:DUF1488 family protein [Burkholderia sp. Nafp2/4-1b]RKU04273.1 DUF1488 domain-containing protein [Burkholderia sp. Nafp2/4-1b]
MDAAQLQPRVAPDGQSITFVLSSRGRNIDCQVTREVLEQHFWVPSGATETRILRAFADGRGRIVAVAERKMLSHGGERVVLTMDDFSNRQ